ncbi:hypothetical protein DKX38_012211 [Salix brachista]|uniref:Uncharacterized protein n=1 Tax=Salix brachista TaxID=2182728 RepID=A0A5N5LMX9_9ROSI|nr:hypothetical protein DKX38_012211 [Salix brachista]
MQELFSTRTQNCLHQLNWMRRIHQLLERALHTSLSDMRSPKKLQKQAYLLFSTSNRKVGAITQSNPRPPKHLTFKVIKRHIQVLHAKNLGIWPVKVGAFPMKLLVPRSRREIVEALGIVDGINPLNWWDLKLFHPKLSTFSFDNDPKSAGSLPVRLLPSNSRLKRFEQREMLAGISPLNELFARTKASSRIILPSSRGMFWPQGCRSYLEAV